MTKIEKVMRELSNLYRFQKLLEKARKQKPIVKPQQSEPRSDPNPPSNPPRPRIL